MKIYYVAFLKKKSNINFSLFCFLKFHTSPVCKDRKNSKCLSFVKNNSLTSNKEVKDICIDKNSNQEIKNNSDYIQYIFKWGIGNKFRSDPENRYHPVHLDRSKEVTIRKTYFDSDNMNIKYEELNEQWEVFWYENNKLNAKPFPIKKFGIKVAKEEAIKFYESLKLDNRLNMSPKFKSGVDNVHYDAITNCWVCFYRLNNFPISRSFSSEYHGFETAKKMAIDRVKKYTK